MRFKQGKDVLSMVVFGERACFSQPGNKAEPATYPIITPSAARGILESIYWKPQLAYEIEAIGILRPPSGEKAIIQTFSVRRNEIKERQKDEKKPIIIDNEKRSQKTVFGLKNVRYLIQARIWAEPHNLTKHEEIFRRRVNNGSCHRRPFLGMREFAAEFMPYDPDREALESTINMDLGRMQYDFRYELKDDKNIAYEHLRPIRKANAVFFEAKVVHGLMMVKRPDLFLQCLNRGGDQG